MPNEHYDINCNCRAYGKSLVTSQPMGRLGTPEEIADLAVYGARATYTSGQAYAIDGGWTI